MAKYQMRQMNDLRKDGRKLKYPKMKRSYTVNLDKIAHDITRDTSFTRADVLGVVTVLAEHIARHIADGALVQIEELGAFSAKLDLKKGVARETEDGTKRNATSIEIGDVRFRPAKELLLRANQSCELSRDSAPETEPVSTTREERLELALSYLKDNLTMSIRDYIRLTGLTRSRAIRELHEWREAHLLGTQGLGTHLRYILPAQRAE